MSRSFHNARRYKARPYAPHKRARHALRQTLVGEAKLATDAWHEVLADVREEKGLSPQAELLRRGAELLVPIAPHGWNTRLRW
ncbi:MAG: hypothetical protein JNM69_19310 [Archangium sp.]|nr:hypothetical protein [Archangium sp.]